MPKSPSSSPELDVEAAKARLRVLGDLLDAVNGDRDSLYEERLQLWEDLTAAGIERAEMAEAAGVTAGMVKFAMTAARKRREEARIDAG